jgi:hypothetical protein
MTPEYVLGAAVAAILLILLFLALRGKRTKRVVMTKNSGTDDQTAQLKRIADALETIASRLHSLSPQIQPQAQERAQPIEAASTRFEKPREEPLPQPTLVGATPAEEHTSSHETPSEPAVADAAAQTQTDQPQKARRIKLSMFGR